MRVLVAPQEFKGTLTAVEAAETIAEGLRAALPDIELDLAPMADGGPGTAAAILAGAGGEYFSSRVHDPLMRPVDATFAVLPTGVAVVECAAASGLWRLRPEELDVLSATTYGTGELIARALDMACPEVIVGLGGSATNDGGAGLAQALGFRLLDESGRDLPPGGSALMRLARIDPAGARNVPGTARFIGATDVVNPLCGPQGAAAVFGPQKGADSGEVALLDAALKHYAEVLKRDLGADVLDLPGTGAAGGLGAGLVAFLGATLRPGAELVARALHLQDRIPLADAVITGEGRLDGQTAFGKTTRHVAGLARALGSPVVCLAGSLGPGHESLLSLFDVVEVMSNGTPAEPQVAREQIAAAAVRALLRLAQQGRAGIR
jgi:glycerate kinase